MKTHDATEQAYKNGYDKGYADGVASNRKKGEWLYDSGSGRYFCSNCGKKALDLKITYEDDSTLSETILSDYCPHCGADMRGLKMANEDRCVCCGAIIPEGRMVCPQCQGQFDTTEDRQNRAQFPEGGEEKC